MRSLSSFLLVLTSARSYPSQVVTLRPTISTTKSMLTTSSLPVKKSRTPLYKSRSGECWEAKMVGCWRPTVNDVERISWGRPAKQKGTGSRGIPHRLNEEERVLFNQARRKGFLEVIGSGWRSQRREAPLLNTYRSLCDARGQASIILHKGNTGVDDEVVVDISTLRNPEAFQHIASFCLERYEGGTIINPNEFVPKKESLMGELEVDDRLVPSSWETRPIYQLPPFCISWELPRQEAKSLGKAMAELFDTEEGKIAPSKKPIGVKPGKNRRHGGYGIG